MRNFLFRLYKTGTNEDFGTPAALALFTFFFLQALAWLSPLSFEVNLMAGFLIGFFIISFIAAAVFNAIIPVFVEDLLEPWIEKPRAEEEDFHARLLFSIERAILEMPIEDQPSARREIDRMFENLDGWEDTDAVYAWHKSLKPGRTFSGEMLKITAHRAGSSERNAMVKRYLRWPSWSLFVTFSAFVIFGMAGIQFFADVAIAAFGTAFCWFAVNTVRVFILQRAK